MPRELLLRESELRELIRLDAAAVAAVEDAFRRLATERVVMPPVMRLDMPEVNGEVDVKSAWLPGLDVFAIKVSPGFFDNPKLGLPSLNGLMLLLSSRTGQTEAVLLDNGYLTAVRTAAAGAVAATWLSREESETAAVIGAGEQARLQLEALLLVRPVRRVRVWARRPEAAYDYAREMGERLKIDIQPVDTVRAAAQDADVVITTTPSSEPLLRGEWLAKGAHVTAMGSDAPHKNELHPSVFERAGTYVADRRSQCEVMGELRHALAAGVVPGSRSVPELGEVIAGRAPGRSDRHEITVADLTGTGAQDTAIAALAFARAQERVDSKGVSTK